MQPVGCLFDFLSAWPTTYYWLKKAPACDVDTAANRDLYNCFGPTKADM